MTASLDKYRTGGHQSVEGWLRQGAVDAIWELETLQRGWGIHGPICEIGVHHGRLFILLHLLTAANERSLAIDLFEMQDQNVDGSGEGSREHLMRNLKKHVCDLTRIELLAQNSLHLLAGRIVELCGGNPRLFSIDGGHTAEATSNDLRLAHDTICDGGLVILDDFFNSAWPGVAEGTCTFMRSGNSLLVPVAITSNKFFFAKGSAAATAYRESLRQAHPNAKLSMVFGQEVLSFEPSTWNERIWDHLRQTIVTTRPWQRFRNTPLGEALRTRIKRWMSTP
jgi:hypothetical protein